MTTGASREPFAPGADAAGSLPLPWLAPALARALALQRSHALLACGPVGCGHLEFAGVLAQAWLCEDPARAPCGRCAACHLVRTRAHPDLLLLVPEALRVQLGWVGDDEPAPKADAKPSRDLRVEQVRQAIDWSHRTSGRGRGKALILHPAERLNAAAANALLKTLEEPQSGLRILLTAIDAERLLPTVRSRCQRLRLDLPTTAAAGAWLAARGVAEPAAVLALAGGSPLQAQEWAAEGIDAAWIAALPQRVAAGDARALHGMPVARVVDLLARLAHDLQARAVGGAARYFTATQWPANPDLAALVAWQRELLRLARHDEHPWHAALVIESLVTQATALWRPGRTTGPIAQVSSLHLAS